MITKKLNFYSLIEKPKEQKFRKQTGIKFVIPEFQRGYSWTEDQLNETFLDLKKAYDYKTIKGYASLGVFYMYRNKFNEFEIIDGQQRFTTMLILLEAIRSSIASTDVEHSLYDENNERILIGYSKDSILEKIYIEFFDNFISKINDVDPDYEEDSTFKSMQNSFFFLKQNFNSEFKKTDEAISFYNFLLKDIHFWPYIEEEENVKFDLFMKLNSRGRQLSFTTLFKSYLYSIDDLELESLDGFTRKQSAIAKYYENDIETTLIRNELRGFKKVEMRDKKIQEACSHFFYLYSSKYIDTYTNLEDPISTPKTLFNGYINLMTEIFNNIKKYVDQTKATKYIKTFMTLMKIYLIKYCKMCIRLENEFCQKLSDINVIKYAPFYPWLEIYKKEKEIDEASLNNIKELIFMYSYARRLKWFVDNKSQLEFNHKTEQLNPRNLRYSEFTKKMISGILDEHSAQSELLSYFNDELKESIKKFLSGDSAIWEKSNNYEKTIQHIDYFLKLYSKYIKD